MRWMAVLVVLLAVPPAQGQENEAEKLFRSMEKKLRSAKTVEVVFEGEVPGEKAKNVKVQGKAILGEGNRFRFDGKVEFDGMKVQSWMVSDGKTIVYVESDGAPMKRRPAPPVEAEKVRACLGQLGVIYLALALEDASATDPPQGQGPFDKAANVKDFKLGAKEKIGQKDAQVVEYTAHIDRTPNVRISVWIDTKTLLPLKRVSEGKKSGIDERYVETYSTFTLDSKIDAKLFEVPK
jgi:outer membrane lipoprotein-sorting protein